LQQHMRRIRLRGSLLSFVNKDLLDRAPIYPSSKSE
jgi:hypothetical protein